MSNINNWGKFFFFLFFSPGHSALFPFVLFYFKAVHSLINVRARIAKYIVWQIRYYILVKDRQSLIKLKYYGNLHPGGKGDRVHLISFIVKEKSKQTNKQNIRSRIQILVGFLLTATEAPLEILWTVGSLLQLTQPKVIPTRDTATKTTQIVISLLAQNNACCLSAFSLSLGIQTLLISSFLPFLPPSLSPFLKMKITVKKYGHFFCVRKFLGSDAKIKKKKKTEKLFGFYTHTHNT